MSAIKKTLLEIVQGILSDIDSEPVNSLSDSNEAEQIARIVEDTFYDLITTRDIPEHQELIKLTALSDSNYPTHFSYPTNTKAVACVWYDKSDDSTFEYREIKWVEPEEFLWRTDKVQSDYTSVSDHDGTTRLRIVNNKHPEFYTSFDDQYIVMNSHKSSVDSTLQESKVRALGVKLPTFVSTDDDHVPDLDGVYFPLLISESRARAMDWFKGGVTQKAEQAARRVRAKTPVNKYNTDRPNQRVDYGRKR